MSIHQRCEPTECIGPDPADISNKMPRIAIIDGVGETAEVYLYASVEDADDGKELDWPATWPKRVTWEFLEAQHCYHRKIER